MEAGMHATPAVGREMEHPDAATLMRRWFDEIWNEGKIESVDELLAEDAIMWGLGRPDQSSRGGAEFKEFYRRQRSATPDVKIRLDQLVQQGDTAFARWTATMTHTGEGLGIPPTNKTIKLSGMSACRALDGKIVEGWNIWDQIGLARQLELLDGLAAEMFP
jgi:steroid delta-isomerase-like uncharacterized protein